MYYPFPYRTVKSKPKTIKVAGEGKISVEPDMAEIRLGVITENLALATAQGENARAISDIKKALAGAGISEKEIKTADYSIHPQYDYVKGRQVFRNYKVDHMLMIRIAEINQAGAIVDTAVKNGANVVSGVTFEASDFDKLYREALSLAVSDARRKAETIAQTLNVQLSKLPLSIAETGSDEIVPYQTKTFAAAEAATSFQPGMLEITSQVHAEFSFASV